MQRIDTANAVGAPESPETGGTPGHFSGGNPLSGQKATYLSSDWCEGVQEELIALIVAGGETPDKTDNAQVLKALRALLASLVPAGSIVEFAGAATPAGYLLCNGSAVSRATYAGLWNAIGTTWGAGDGSTTFNLPDLRGRAPIGAGTGAGLTARALAAKAGEETHVLTTGEVPSLQVNGTAESAGGHTHGVTDNGHTHGVTDNGHTHNFGVYLSDTSGAHAADGSGGLSNTIATDSSTTGVTVNSATTGVTVNSDGAHTHTVGGTTSGDGGAHNNMQPFAVVNFIIKT